MFPNILTIPWVTRWFQWGSIMRYTLEAMSVAEYLHIMEQDDVFYVNGTQYVCNYAQKADFIKKWMVIDDLSYKVWGRDFGIACAITSIFLIMTYVGLWRSSKQKQ